MLFAASVLCGALLSGTTGARAATPTWQDQVDTLFGMKGHDRPQGFLRINIIRENMLLFVQGVPTLPELGLDGYVAFKMEGASGALMVGELPLLESEVNPVIDTLQAGRLYLTATHNHFLFEYPRMIFVHMDGVGDPVQMAKVVESAIRKTGIPRVNDDNQTDRDDVVPGLDTRAIDAVLGHSRRFAVRIELSPAVCYRL